jgi:DNA-binding NarL/FixJ family response regulator
MAPDHRARTPGTARVPRPPSHVARQIRILLADSQTLDRAGMRAMLATQRDFEVVEESASVQETLERAQVLLPDVVVLSLHLGGQDRSAAVPALRAAMPSLRIVALSERGDSNCLVLNPPSRRHLPNAARCELGTDCLQLAAAQGAMATLRRDADPEQLFRAIRTVANGERALTAPRDSRAGNDRRPLSRRELEVGALIADGRSNKEISAALQVSDATTKKHVRHLIAKLGLADRLQVGVFLTRHPQLFER